MNTDIVSVSMTAGPNESVRMTSLLRTVPVRRKAFVSGAAHATAKVPRFLAEVT
jgi:hypothetical protein